MNEDKAKTQVDLKNYLLQKKVNEQRTNKLMEKLKYIEKKEKEKQAAIKQRKQ